MKGLARVPLYQLRIAYTYDAANQLQTSVAGPSSYRATYTYDAAGNLQIEDAPGGRTTYTWDGENRLALLETPSSNAVNTMTYRADGLRAEDEESPVCRRYVWDGQRLLMETDGSDTTEAVYTLQPDEYGNLISQRRGGASSFYHFDALGSTSHLTDASESVTEEYLYPAYGGLGLGQDSTNPFRWGGASGYFTEQYDNCIYIRARYYAHGEARWRSADPIESEPNLYRYVGGNPVMRVDPSGTKPCDSCGAEYYWDLKATLDKVETVLERTVGIHADPPPSPTVCDVWRHVRWDISELFWSVPTAPECQPSTECCRRCVTILGRVQDRYEVNFALWGFLMASCDYSLAAAKTEAVTYKTIKGVYGAAKKKPLEDCEYRFQYTDSVSKWIEAGYRYSKYYLKTDHGTPGWYHPVWTERERSRQPLSMNMPQTDNPLFKSRCSPCSTEAHSPNRSSTFFLFIGLGEYFA